MWGLFIAHYFGVLDAGHVEVSKQGLYSVKRNRILQFVSKFCS